jgi:putative DNA primase/helicase
MTLSKTGKAASEYASVYNIPVFPLWPKSKNPMTKRGFLDASTSNSLVSEWWTNTPNANIGGVMGNGYVCIDFDVDENGAYNALDWLSDWESEHGKLPETATAITGRGGMHLFYRVDHEIKKSENGDIHVDIRGAGSYAMLAPSVHPNGNTVYWDLDPDEYGFADANELVYKLIDEVQIKKSGNKEKVKVPSRKVKEGEGRNKFLYEQGCSARAKGSDDEMIRIWITELNKQKCSPPLGNSELTKIINSVCSNPVGLSDEAKELQQRKSTKTANHVLIANRILDQYSACFLDGMPAVFDGLSYHVGWDMVERVVLSEWPNAKERDRKEVIKYLNLIMPRHRQSDPRFIGFKNGVLDTETMELLSFSPDFKITNVIPHDWVPDAHSEVLETTLRKIACNDPYIENNLAEFIGLCMYRSGKYAFAAILLGRQGETASNGKSTYIDLIREILGEDNYSSLSLHVLGERFYQDYLAGKLANLGDDISSSFTKGQSLEVFKKAVAGSELTTDVKGTKGYKFKPYCTMIFSANEFPRLENLDDGVLRRLFPIRFNAHFTPLDPDYDPDIGDKLKQEDAIEAAIVRGVWGLKRVIRNRRPTDNEESRMMVRDIRINNSSIYQWIEDEGIDRDLLLEMTIGNAYGIYEAWCKNSGISNKFAKWQFSKEICSFFKFRILSTTRESRRVRILVNL